MTINMGTTDRIVRGIVGVGAIVVALLAGAGSVLGIILWIVAALMLGTAAVGFCPLYAALHIDSLGGTRKLSLHS
jgi:hypothetical protein